MFVCLVLITLQIVSSDTFRTNSNVQIRSAAFSTISRLSRGCRYIPHSYWIDPRSVKLPDGPQTCGACALVFRGEQGDVSVAVKVLKSLGWETPSELKKASTGGRYEAQHAEEG